MGSGTSSPYLFAKARIMTRGFHTDANGVPLGAEEDRDVWKPLFLDVGLMLHGYGLGEADVAAMSDLRRRGRCGMMDSTNDKGARTNG